MWSFIENFYKRSKWHGIHEIEIGLLSNSKWCFLKKLEWIREMRFEPKYRACPQNFPDGFDPGSLIVLPLLLIRPCYAAGFDNRYVESRSLQLFYLCLWNLFTSTLHCTWQLF